MAGQTPGGGGLSFANVTEELLDGIMVGCSVFASDDAISFYRTFAIVDLLRGGQEADNRVFQLAAGYVSFEFGLSNSFFIRTRTDDFARLRVRGNINASFHVKYFYLDREIEKALFNASAIVSSTVGTR